MTAGGNWAFALAGLAAVLVALPGLPVPAPSAAPMGHEAGGSARPLDAARPALPNGGEPNRTLSIPNGSVLAGNVLTGNGRHPVAGVYDPWNANTYVVDEATGAIPTANVTVVHGPDRSVVATDAIGSGPTGPLGIAADPATGDVYVANTAFSSVSVINGTSQAIQATVPVGLGPQAVAYDPVAGAMVVANTESGSLSFITATSDRVTSPVPVGVSPTAIAFDPVDSALWIADPAGDSVEVVRATTGALLASVYLGAAPGALAVDPVSGDAFVAIPSGSNVSEINASSFRITYSLGVTADPNAIVFDAQDADLYVASGTSGALSILNPRTHRLIAQVSIPGRVASATYDPFNGEVYLGLGGAGGVVALRGTASFPVGTVSTGNGTRGLIADPSDGWLYVCDVNASALVVVNASSNQVLTVLPTAAAPPAILYNATFDQWFVADPQVYGPGVLVINGTTDRIVSRTLVGVDPAGLTSDPANGSLVVVDAGAEELTFLSPSDGHVVLASSLPFPPAQVAFDPLTRNLFVSNPLNASVTIVNGTNGGVLGTIPVGRDPTYLAFDPVADAMVVSDTGGASLSVLDARSALLAGTIPLGGAPGPLVYDPSGGELVVDVAGGAPGGGQNALEIFAGPTLAPSDTLPATPQLGALAFDPVDGLVYVAEPGESKLVVIDGSSGAVEGSVPALGGARAVAFGGRTATLGVAEGSAGSVSFVNPATLTGFPVTFQETGLPSGAAWSVTLDGQANRSARPGIGFSLPNGTNYSFTIGVVLGFRAEPPQGVLNVTGSPVTETIRFVLAPSPGTTSTPGFLGFAGYQSIWAFTFLGIAIAAVALLVTRQYLPERFDRLRRVWIAARRAIPRLPRRRSVPGGPLGTPATQPERTSSPESPPRGGGAS